ncbi:hypothetical protein [Amorphus orientalis]|uniref:Uncharacterized protein n=1 Tax=Amorphus orientalis TaxID=649198 RepID=A0AAE3VMC3_9HYPH|nr:hypothetical protein [Amorphus orientalis]MDQ0314687.1 hypothetical protein [Amorphus orientalis]
MTRHPAPWFAALVFAGLIGPALPAGAQDGAIERRLYECRVLNAPCPNDEVQRLFRECRLDMSCNAAAATLYRVLQAERDGRTGHDATMSDGPDGLDLFAQGGDADGPIDLFEETDPVERFADEGEAGAPIDLSRESGGNQPVDLFDEAGADPVDRFPDRGDAGEPIDLFKDGAADTAGDTAADGDGGFSHPDPEVEQAILRCAAGFGCDGSSLTESDAQVLTDMTRDTAGDAYAERYPDAYLDDAFGEGGEGADAGAREPIDLFNETDPVERFPDEGEAGAPIDLSRETGGNEPVDLFDEAGTDPVDRFPDRGDTGDPIDLFKDANPTEPADVVADPGDPSASDAAVEQQLLRCAAGFGCNGSSLTEGDAQVLTDMTREQAGDAYAERYPDAYLDDAFGDGGEQAEAGRGEPVDLFKGEAGEREPETARRPADETAPAEAGSPEGGLPDFAAMEGFATSPCSGTAFEWPDFMHMAGHKVATCQQAANGRYGGCGQPAANLFCLTNGYHRAACFGVGTAARALNAGVYCTGGACSAFSFIVCE